MEGYQIPSIEPQNKTSLEYALICFVDGIRKYKEDKFDDLRQKIKQSLSQLTNDCKRSCSKTECHVKNWCKVCSSWREMILRYHSHKVMAKFKIKWKLLDSSMWPSSTSEMTKCFYPSWCFKEGAAFNDDDPSVIINSMVNCNRFPQLFEQVRCVRNEVAHNDQFTTETKANMCECLINVLRNNNIQTYREAKDGKQKVTLFRDKSMQEIHEERLMEEETLQLLEDQLYGRKNHLNCSYTSLSITGFVCVFSVIIGVFLSFIIQYTNSIQDFKEVPTGFRSQLDSIFYPNKPFTERDWLFDDIQRHLQDDNRGIILIDEQGYGKTTVVEQLVFQKRTFNHYDIVYHFCRDNSKTLRDPASFVLNIVYSLYTKYPQYKTVIDTQVQMSNDGIANSLLTSCILDPLYCARGLLRSLNQIEAPANKLLIIVDSLDKCSDSGESIEKVLRDIYLQMPTWIKFLLTMRNITGLTSHYEKFYLMHLKTSDARHKQKFENLVESVMKEKTIRQLTMQNYDENDNISVLIDSIKNLSATINHDFLFYDEFLQYRLMTKDKLSYLSKVPPSIVSIYEREMSFLFGDCLSSFDNTRVFWNIISASFEPLTTTDLLRYIADMTKYTINEILHDNSPHLLRISEIENLSFRHPFFKQWLTSRYRDGYRCFLDIENGHVRTTNKMLQECVTKAEEHCSKKQSYIIIGHLLEHMQKSNKSEKIQHHSSTVIDKETSVLWSKTFSISDLDLDMERINWYKIMRYTRICNAMHISWTLITCFRTFWVEV